MGRSCHKREQGPHPKMGGSQAGLSGSRKKQVKQCPEPGGPTRGLKQRVWAVTSQSPGPRRSRPRTNWVKRLKHRFLTESAVYPKLEGPEGLTQHGQQHPLPERASEPLGFCLCFPNTHTSLSAVLVILGTDIKQIQSFSSGMALGTRLQSTRCAGLPFRRTGPARVARPQGRPVAGGGSALFSAFDPQGAGVAFVCCCGASGILKPRPYLPGPAGPGPVAHADPAVPVRQLQAAPAGEQLCVHPHPAGRPLCNKDTVSFQPPLGACRDPAPVTLRQASGRCTHPRSDRALHCAAPLLTPPGAAGRPAG